MISIRPTVAFKCTHAELDRGAKPIFVAFAIEGSSEAALLDPAQDSERHFAIGDCVDAQLFNKEKIT